MLRTIFELVPIVRRGLPPSFAIVALLVALTFMGCAASPMYIVQPGDSLPQIALTHDITLSALIKANQDEYPALAVDPDHPSPGTELVLPSQDGNAVDEWFGQLARAASAPITPAPDVPAAPNEKIIAVVELIRQGINRERVANNLAPLAFETNLADVAQARSNDMIQRGYFSHIDPQRNTIAFQDLLKSRSYRFLFAGENIAEIKNQGSSVPSGLTVYARYSASEIAKQIVNGWVNSADHRENILNLHFSKTGIALGVSVDGTRVVATQIFSD